MFDDILKFVITGLVKLMEKIIPAGLYIGTVNEVRSEFSLYRRPVGISSVLMMNSFVYAFIVS